MRYFFRNRKVPEDDGLGRAGCLAIGELFTLPKRDIAFYCALDLFADLEKSENLDLNNPYVASVVSVLYEAAGVVTSSIIKKMTECKASSYEGV